MSDEMAKLAEALAKAQTDFKPIVKDRQVSAGQMKYSYADLSTVREAVTEGLTKNGLAVMQTFRAQESGDMHIVTTLAHAAGGSMESVYPVKMGQNHQQNGAAISYARRYSLCAILGVVAEDDTDGHAVKSRDKADKAPKKTPAEEAAAWVERQKNIIREFPNRVMYAEWKVQSKREMERLKANHPELAAKFDEWLTEWYDSKEAA